VTSSGREQFHDNSPSHPYSTVRSLPNGLHFVSGVLPYDQKGHLVTTGSPAAVVDGCISELRRRLEACGLTLGSVIQTTVYLTDIEWRTAVNAAYSRTFRAPMPARTTIEVAGLPAGSPIEIDAVVFGSLAASDPDAVEDAGARVR
jgi:2-iminobutanoate/2-iminopropanoate deaminase